MRYHVVVRILGTAVGQDVPALQAAVGATSQKLLASGKVVESGVFADARAAFFLLDIDSAEEMFELFAGVEDWSTIESHPVVSFERLGQYFQQQAAR
jgi:hypothetical protein